ncbi:FAD-binding domain-containing protein [Lophiostoma macrostomum CBS 122681]|uniref:FAD-binding domain-containing protein n=1 Tax=Lophiostoma macrostomum CBS 122681 TaxID=1314788 RepID=A0A6A6SV19_9PLEO|nr:FAD-binding domain-containing protein [Lophiostoma macrostomum CBS 122681]
MLFLRAVAASAILLASLAYADTCSTIEALGTIEVSRPVDVHYTVEQTEYWSISCSALLPSCILYPKNAAEVALIVKSLGNTTETFAVKSGGHNPNNYFSSVDGGPLISTEKMDQAIIDTATGIVDVGPGNRLDGIAAKLQGSGWTFVGGRIGNTGVGGLVLGGGLSYFSAQVGWAASMVQKYEIVFANGTVANVTRDSNIDLFKSLKGGGNNFGIITNYHLQAIKNGDVWGGNLVFAVRTPSLDSSLLGAVRDFAEYNTDPKAAVIVTGERGNVDLIDSWILFLFYDGATPPAGIFTNFTSLPHTLDTTRTRTYADLMADSNWVIVKAEVVDIATETIPLPSAANKQTVMDGLHAHWRNVSDTVLAVPGIVASIAWQPFPKAIARQAKANGPDLIDADDSVDRIIIEMNYSFLPVTPYDTMADVAEATYSGVRNRVVAWQADGTLPDAYLPLFMNYGFYRQDYWGRLRPESRALAKRVQQEVDPQGLFRTRTGGWRP